MSMRLKTTILIILILFITTAANFFISLYFTTTSLQETVEQDLTFAIGIADNLVSTKMNLIKSEAITIGERLPKNDSGEGLTEAALRQFDEFPEILGMTIFNRDGVIFSCNLPPHEHDVELSGKYIEVVYNGATTISSPFYCSARGEYVMNVYTPLGSGRILAVTIPGSTFTDLLSGHTLWKTGSIFMLNEEGGFIGGATSEIILALDNYSGETGGRQVSTDGEIRSVIQTILMTEHGVDRYHFDGVENLCAYSRIDNSMMGWRVVLTVPIDESPQSEAIRVHIYTVILFLLIGIISAFFLAALTAEPFRKIKDQNRELEKSNATIQAQAAAIREEHSRVKLMLDATPLACRLWSRDFRMVDCNEAVVKLFGLRDKKEYLDRWLELSPEYQNDGQATDEKLKALINEAFEKGSCTYDWMYQTFDGTPIPSELTLVRIPYEGGYVVASYSRDLREQKKMLAEIEQRDNLLQTVNMAADILLRSEPDNFTDTLRECMGMMTGAIDADHMYIYKNHTRNGKLCCARLFGWPEDSWLFQNNDPGKNISYDNQIPETKNILLQAECVHALIRDMPVSDKVQYSAQDILAVLFIPVFIRNEFWGFVGFDNCRDERLFSENEESVMRSGSLLIVNALLRNESILRIQDTSARLETALTDAKEANSAKSNFLAHMSHEIRTPLNAVIGLSELTLGEGKLDREAELNLEKIYGAGSTILSIVNDILDISKIESGKFETYPVQYDAPSLINDVVTLNVVRIGEKPIAFKLYVNENFPGVLYGDDLRVKQIFNNLLSNAFKYTNAGTVEWRVTFEREGDNIWIDSSVEDTGRGIRPEDVKKLFSDYNQVDMKTNRSVQGTGLGLAITKRLVEMMDGNITVESEYGKGTVFRVRLRQAFISETPIGKEVAANLMSMRYTLARRIGKANQGRVNLSYAHVLVVDDVATNLDVVKGMMKPYGLKIDCVTSGEEAIEMIRAGYPRYSAVFMDHMMPGMDGIEAARIIRERIGTDYALNIPIIALTANAIVGNEEMFLSQGFQDFISKPIDIPKLDAVLRRWVRDKETEKELSDKGEGGSLPETGNSGADGGISLLEGVTIGGVNLPGGLSRFGGNEQVFIDVLRSYAANIPQLLVNLKEYLDTNDFVNYAIVVHGIKGASYSIFAEEAGKAAETLEFAAKEGRYDTVRTGHYELGRVSEALLDKINRALGEIEAVTRKPLASAPDPALLEELRLASGEFDMDGVDRAMARLESFRYESGGKLVTWLREQINNMTFEVISGGEWPSE